MKYYITIFITLILSASLTGCIDILDDDDEENAEACSEGDGTACDELEQELAIATQACDDGDLQSCLRKEALDAILESIPTALAVASNTKVANAGNDSEFSSKQNRINEFLDNTLSSTDFTQCLDAFPQKNLDPNPLCYGPGLEYENHPDSSSGTQDGDLPTGDVGLWVATEPGTTTACAAAKLNEQVSKVSYNVDLAIGSMAFMACGAALLGEALPADDGERLDLSSRVGQITSTNTSVSQAVITRQDTNDGNKAYKTQLALTINSQEYDVDVYHDAITSNGLLVVQTQEDNNDARGTSVVYALSDTSIQYKMISALAQPSGTEDAELALASDGQVSLHNDADINVMQGDINPGNGYGAIAYAWKAGGNDSHYRALNVETASTNNGSGHAYYGYVPAPDPSSESINLDLAQSNAGMICNWAGPGNSHTVTSTVQYQALSLNNGSWVADDSNIQYAPTTSCDLTQADIDNGASFTPSFNFNSGSLSTNQQAIIDNGTIDEALDNNLLDKSTGTDFTLPSTPSVPE